MWRWDFFTTVCKQDEYCERFEFDSIPSDSFDETLLVSVGECADFVVMSSNFFGLLRQDAGFRMVLFDGTSKSNSLHSCTEDRRE